MGPRQNRTAPRTAVFQLDGVDASVAAHVRDRFATLHHYTSEPLGDVCAGVRAVAVAGYGRLIEVEAYADTPTGRAQARAEADSVCAAVDKVRDRLCIRLAEHELRAARASQPETAHIAPAHKGLRWWLRWGPKHRDQGGTTAKHGDGATGPERTRR
ncbi:hypothetical protein [Streptomonospora wellingtoniae]|uniref:HPF/RaiA family ribosome-associated protein n=1 Tax=Streptomonospora wellingtoniae TaxID=3075544 RepID=A0ABU2L0V9_9ACTN|nr:hypothetical protein [Streptomonospora sp. DSM 45055]MDT0305196.1 hypothetical protein [Streptomonospora sp. DSM 45055]